MTNFYTVRHGCMYEGTMLSTTELFRSRLSALKFINTSYRIKMHRPYWAEQLYLKDFQRRKDHAGCVEYVHRDGTNVVIIEVHKLPDPEVQSS